MKTVKAVYNAGRWIVTCPVHGAEGAVLAANYKAVDPSQSGYFVTDEYICPVCYPGITAQMQVVQKGRIVTIPDKSARATAHLMAKQNEEIHHVVFPKERAEIEKILSSRPRLMQNWDGKHETLDFLREENKIVEVMRGV